MPFIQHHATQAKDTTVNLQALETANNLVAEQWYFSTTNNRFYYAALSNQLVGPIDPGVSSVTFADTDTITHTDNGGGNFSFNLRVDPAAGNILTSSADGLFAQDIGIAAGSQNYLEYNSATREISVKNLLITDVTVDTVSATMAAWITANYTGTEFEEGDLVVLTVPDNKESWINNGGVLGTIADWTNISANIDDAYIRSLISAGPGITYNSATGQISVALSSASNNALSFSGGELFLSTQYGWLTNGQGVSVGSTFGSTLRIQAPDLMEVTQPSSSGNIKAFDFAWDTSGASVGQVATFDGTNVVWDDPAGADPLEHWAEALDNSGINASRPVISWSVDNAAADVDAVISPKGQGAFTLQVADGTMVGGNKRGIHAVDLQTYRETNSNRVASGDYSVIIGGRNNQASGNYSIAAGFNSNSSGLYSIAIGNQAVANNDREVVIGGDTVATGGQGEGTMIMNFPNGVFTKGSITDLDSTLRVRNISEDNALTRVLVADAQGNIRRRDVSTIGGGANIYSEDGALSGNRNVGLAGYSITFRDSSDNNMVRFSESGSTIRAMAGDIEVDTAGSGLIIKSPNGTRHRITVANAGFLQTTAL